MQKNLKVVEPNPALVDILALAKQAFGLGIAAAANDGIDPLLSRSMQNLRTEIDLTERKQKR